ncbi:DUF6513 domain-containing protein [Lignipirellula cremea]|uniref:Pterin binding enzyme n=1 Tax=Lignipirellula cremea TaxID=2528010 RepID=A0A518DV76_9BACT|nr:DUF6513 domain-containing protein [Lignipirellula cremea]QDU95740.1 Pterin binding enzyme [Lignipirellula cremea]
MSIAPILFVTGKLAEPALREQLEQLAPVAGFDYVVQVMPITVAALLTTDWVSRRIEAPGPISRVVLPGYCGGDLAPVEQAIQAPVERGPRDLRRLPEYFGQTSSRSEDYGRYDIEIVAEINHAPRLTLAQILQKADALRADGADLIDVGCDPGGGWSGVGECVRALKSEGHRVSIDSLTPSEIAPAVAAGAELVLSVNSSNRHAAADWGCEVVAIPDDPRDLESLVATAEHLEAVGAAYRLDPILEPIGCGFAASLGRYIEIRRRFPHAEMMMGIGNLTELTDVDSAGVNVLLLGVCQELSIRSVLTTQVINWARTSVRECDLGRRLVYHAVARQTPPKHLEPLLVLLRDPQVSEFGAARLEQLATQIRDQNYRLFAEPDGLHLLNATTHLSDEDPFRLFDALLQTEPKNLDAAHAFYLGYELAKASIARTLKKDYRQDEALEWGYLTEPETSHRLSSKPVQSKPNN